jgi:hypothetical protein
MSETSQRVKTRNCKGFWRKSIKRVESDEAHVVQRERLQRKVAITVSPHRWWAPGLETRSAVCAEGCNVAILTTNAVALSRSTRYTVRSTYLSSPSYLPLLSQYYSIYRSS